MSDKQLSPTEAAQELFNPAHPIMIVDDDRGSLLFLEALLRKAGLGNTVTCADSRKVFGLLEEQPVAAILLDLLMPYISGEELLAKIRQEYPDVPVIIVTGTEEVEMGVRCIKLGAVDYVVKPVDPGRLVSVVENVLVPPISDDEDQDMGEGFFSTSVANPEAFADIVTKSKKMLALFHYAELVAHSSEPVLVTGETGVGKELLVRVVHELSERSGSFVTVNVAGLDDNMFSDTLFGHARGAFTGAERGRSGLVEQAGEGTLFLDEIGDLASASQSKLLRLLQDGDYMALGRDELKHSNARIVSATNCDLWGLSHDGVFRKDLNFRLRTHHIHIPPLRQRREDLPLLIDYFLTQAADKINRKRPAVSKAALRLLEEYDFPGNIRELRAMIFNAVSLSKDATLSIEPIRKHLSGAREDRPDSTANSPVAQGVVDFSGDLPTLKDATDMLIKEAIRRAEGNQTLAGRMLGISQQAISKRIKNLEQE